MEQTTLIIALAIVSALVGAAITLICIYPYNTSGIDEKIIDEIIEKVDRQVIETDIDILYEKINVIHGRIANLEKRIEPIGFQEVLTKHIDAIATICGQEFSKLFQDSHNERNDTNNNG